MDLTRLVGAGDRIGLATAPVIVIGVIANVALPATFAVGGPPDPLRLASAAFLLSGSSSRPGPRS